MIDLYDRMKRLLGKTVPSGAELPREAYQICAEILTVNEKSEILLTKRPQEKSDAGCRAIPGGFVLAGETERTAAVRLLETETGIIQSSDDMIFCGNRRRKNRIMSYFLTFAEGREVPGCRWVAPEQFLHIAASGNFTGAEPAVYLSYYAAFFSSKPVPKRLRAAGKSLRDVRLPEILDLYRPDGTPTGMTTVRGGVVPAGTCRMIVSILTLGSDGKILITRRAPEKSYAGCWEVTGGCVQAGESAVQAAVRELYEETGIRVRAAALEDRGSRCERSVIFRYFLLRYDADLTQVTLQPGETDAADRVTPEQFLELFRRNMTFTSECVLLCGQYPELFGETT